MAFFPNGTVRFRSQKRPLTSDELAAFLWTNAALVHRMLDGPRVRGYVGI